MKRGQAIVLVVATVLAGVLAYLTHDSLKPYVGPVSFSAAAARAMKVQLPDGSVRDVAKPTGKLFVLHFWATWCAPCAEELPGLLAYAREIRNDPSIELLAVSVDDNLDTVRGWLKERGAADLPIALDKGRAIATRMGTEKFPETYLISAKGAIVGAVKGPVDWSSKEIRAQIDELRRDPGAKPVAKT